MSENSVEIWQPVEDTERLDWLEARGVVSIYFADGRQFNPASMSLRAAIDAARSTPPARRPIDSTREVL